MSSFLLLVGLFLHGMLPFPGTQRPGSDSCRESPLTRCGLEGFTKSPTEHIIVERHEPFRVRSVEGVITNQAGEWPEDIHVVFEIRPLSRTEPVRSTKTDAHGRFKMNGVPPGEYCFKATVNGWQSVVGTLIVAKKADAGSRIAFEMLLGV